MKLRVIAAFAGLGGAMIWSGEAEGAYIGLGLQLHTTVTINDVARDVWRVYAVFDDPDQFVGTVGGSVANGAATIKNLNADGTGLGTGFFNAGMSKTAPKVSGGVFVDGADAEWDTFVTLGVSKDDINEPNDDFTALSPGFPSFVTGNQWGPTNSAAWFVPGPKDQGKSGNGLNGTFTNNGESLSGLGVLVAQLSVNSGEHVAGTVFVNVNTPPVGWTSHIGQTFSSVPGPGVMAAVGLAGLMGTRRRRN